MVLRLVAYGRPWNRLRGETHERWTDVGALPYRHGQAIDVGVAGSASTTRHSWKAKPMVHNVALVLGGGGAAGQAWQTGVIAGLAEAGLDLTEAADLVIGTSSGSTAAAHVRSGIPAAELLASVLSPPVQPAGQNREQPPSLPMATVFERMRAIGAAARYDDYAQHQRHPLHQRWRALRRKRRPCRGAMRTSWCSPRSADRARGHLNGQATREASSRACADFRARTWQARPRPCASRAATSR